MIRQAARFLWNSRKQILSFVRFLISKPVIITALLLIQIWLLARAIVSLGSQFTYLYVSFVVLSYVIALRLLNSSVNPAFKLALIIPIIIFPVFGGPFYLIFGSNRVGVRERRIFSLAWSRVAPWLKQDPKVLERLRVEDRLLAGQAGYIGKYSSFPVYQNTECTFLASGDLFFEELLRNLENAEHYIFLEFFIIRPGKVWTQILEILERKVAQGVEVRLVYDDMGCTFQLPPNYYRQLRAKGIKCTVFNPYRPTLSLSFNHRDHRKIVVIDGHTGYTGGINLDDAYADSYSEVKGTWCDSAVKLTGEAVWNLTIMFLQAWNYEYPEEEDLDRFRPQRHHPEPFTTENCYIQPFGDTPFDTEAVSETVYMNIINQAIDYLYITTPYLVTSNELMTALCSAAKRGVQIKLLVPATVENWLIHSVTEAHFPQLIAAGAEIYRYTPGFIHGKNLLCDDKVGIVGTVNLDFRSLYLNFECAVWIYGCQSLGAIKSELEDQFARSDLISYESCLNKPWPMKLAQSFMRTLAPLL